ncbi:MAG: L,D-transpeptidase [Actinomycetota bacterium]
MTISKRAATALDELTVEDGGSIGLSTAVRRRRGLVGSGLAAVVLVLGLVGATALGVDVAGAIARVALGEEQAGGLSEEEIAELRSSLEANPSLVATADPGQGRIVAYAGPGADADELHVFEYDVAHPEHFLSVATFDDIDHLADERLEVYLPVRPNGTVGWIDLADITLTEHRYRIEIDTGDHRLAVFDGTEQMVDTPIGVGTGATPTPLGFFFTSTLYDVPDPDGAYGPYAFGLSGYSETVFDFNGGDGVIGIHGTNDKASLGTDVSHGCVRLDNDVISMLATTIPLGTPVLITA